MSMDINKELEALLNPARKNDIPPFVLDEGLYPMEQENALIDYFRHNWTRSNKRLVKIVNTIYNDVPRFMQRSLLDNLLKVANPKRLLLEYFQVKEEWNTVIQRLLDEGNHGVIYGDKNVHGFVIEANPKWLKENDKWNRDDEQDIIKRSYYKWCRENNITYFKGKVLMFHQYGFSGMSYAYAHPIDDKEGY